MNSTSAELFFWQFDASFGGRKSESRSFRKRNQSTIKNEIKIKIKKNNKNTIKIKKNSRKSTQWERLAAKCKYSVAKIKNNILFFAIS